MDEQAAYVLLESPSSDEKTREEDEEEDDEAEARRPPWEEQDDVLLAEAAAVFEPECREDVSSGHADAAAVTSPNVVASEPAEDHAASALVEGTAAMVDDVAADVAVVLRREDAGGHSYWVDLRSGASAWTREELTFALDSAAHFQEVVERSSTPQKENRVLEFKCTSWETAAT